MPQAPGLTPTAVPSGFAPEVNLPVPVDAFGGAVGHALEGLGGQIEQSSDRIWGRAIEMQGLQNETEAKEADAKYMMQSGLMHADFINKEGLNAGPEALQKHIQELQDLRTSIRGSLSNPAAQRMYDASSLGFMGRNIFNAAGHSGQQMKVASNNAADARIDGLKTNVGNNPEDDIGFARSIQAIRAENARKASNMGWTPEQLDATNRKDTSEVVARRAVGLADNKNAIVGQRYLDLAKKNNAIDDVTADKVQATLTTKFNDQGSRIISDKVLAGRRNGDEENRPVQEYIDEARKEAEKYAYKDPLFPDIVERRVVADYNRQKAIETDADNMNTRVIGQALIKGNSEGMLPTSIEELKAIDPAVGPAWDAMGRNPQKQQAVLKQLDQNAKGGRVTTTPENLQQYHTWRGQAMAGTDEQRAEFMAHNFGTEEKMTLAQRNQLMNLQDQLKHRAAIATTDDPRIARALRFLGPDMAAAGITRGTADARSDYFTFVGSLQDQLDQYQKDHPGKLPTHEELTTMGAQLLQEQHTHWWQGSQKFYQMPAPTEDLDRLRADPYWKSRGVTPTDEMLNRIYRAEQFREKYGGSAKKPAEAQFPPNAPEGK